MDIADIIMLCIFGVVEIILIISLIVTHFQEKKMKEKPRYYSAVGDWLCGRRRW